MLSETAVETGFVPEESKPTPLDGNQIDTAQGISQEDLLFDDVRPAGYQRFKSYKTSVLWTPPFGEVDLSESPVPLRHVPPERVASYLEENS